MATQVCMFDKKCKKVGCWSLHPKRDALSASASASKTAPVVVKVTNPSEYVIPVPYTNCPHCMAFVFSGHCGCKTENVPDVELQFREIEELYTEAPEVVEHSTDEEDETAEELALTEHDALVEEDLINAELAEEDAYEEE